MVKTRSFLLCALPFLLFWGADASACTDLGARVLMGENDLFDAPEVRVFNRYGESSVPMFSVTGAAGTPTQVFFLTEHGKWMSKADGVRGPQGRPRDVTAGRPIGLKDPKTGIINACLKLDAATGVVTLFRLKPQQRAKDLKTCDLAEDTSTHRLELTAQYPPRLGTRPRLGIMELSLFESESDKKLGKLTAVSKLDLKPKENPGVSIPDSINLGVDAELIRTECGELNSATTGTAPQRASQTKAPSRAGK